MKFTLNWLKDHLETSKDLNTIVETLTSIGLEIENVEDKSKIFNDISSNTVIGVVATDAPLTRANLKRLAIMAHDGIARSLSPSHTPMDGDTIFAITTGKDLKEQVLENVDILALGARASDCVARACNRAVYEAEGVGKSKPGWKTFFKNK